ncbi:hypothetical protein [Iodobacter fluviatilis]|uniref:hypothetical protein n=1 Tax=Iodobacter fluviatilis TaxID=537 RepID=UPI000E1B70F0|nr:hypothetical protein [Iodobacter fluviatilis]
MWRSGKVHTLSSWQIATPAAGPAQLSVRMANPEQAIVQKQWVLDDTFWHGSARVLLPESSE